MEGALRELRNCDQLPEPIAVARWELLGDHVAKFVLSEIPSLTRSCVWTKGSLLMGKVSSVLSGTPMT